MSRYIAILALFLLVGLRVGLAAADPSGTQPPTKAQAINAGFNCNPDILIFGHFHCSPPGDTSLQDVLNGARPATFQLTNYSAPPDPSHPDPNLEFFLGTEQLIRADLFRNQKCPQSASGQWTPLDFTSDPDTGDVDYYACHHWQ